MDDKAGTTPSVSPKASNPTPDEEAAASTQPVSQPEHPMSTIAVALVMFTLMLTLFQVSVESSLVTALPTIVTDLQAPSGFLWIPSTYLLGLAASLPCWSNLSDIWGQKSIILIANGLFAIGSLIAALAPNLSALLVGRVVQGASGGGLLAMMYLIISHMFPDMRTRTKNLSLLGISWAIGSATGPLIGGAFAQATTWRWCFYFNLPISGVNLIFLACFLHLKTEKRAFRAGIRSIDLPGLLTLTSGTVMFLLGLQMGGVTFPWNSATVVCLLVFGILTCAAFFVVEWKISSAMDMRTVVSPALMRKPSTITLLLVCMIHGFLMTGSFVFLPFFFQICLDATPILAAVWILPLTLATTVSTVVTGQLAARTGRVVEPMIFGMLMSALGFGLLADLTSSREWGKIIGYQIILGVGLGPNTQMPIVALQRLLTDQSLLAGATTALMFMRNLGSAASTVIGGAIIQNQMERYTSAIVSRLGVSTASSLGGGDLFASVELVNSLPAQDRLYLQNIFVSAIRPQWFFACGLAGLGLLLSFCLDRTGLAETQASDVSPVASSEHGESASEEKQRSASE